MPKTHDKSWAISYVEVAFDTKLATLPLTFRSRLDAK